MSKYSSIRLGIRRFFSSGVSLTPKVTLPHASPHVNTKFKPTLIEGKYRIGDSLNVPPKILRPNYSIRTDGVPDKAQYDSYGEVKDQESIDNMIAVGKLAGLALQLAIDSTKPGVSGSEVEKIVHDFIISHGAYPSPLHFHGFPKSLVISVNEACCHGVPNDRPFESGDVVKYDCVVYLNGFHGDCAATVGVGELSSERQKLIHSCRLARDAAIKLCKPGITLDKIGDCIGDIASDNNFGVLDLFCGHFIGRDMHMMPLIQHIRNRNKYVLKPGNCFTIEPIFTEGSTEIVSWRDGWTVVTKDFGFSSQWEHTILITDSGAEVLTPLRDEQQFD